VDKPGPVGHQRANDPGPAARGSSRSTRWRRRWPPGHLGQQRRLCGPAGAGDYDQRGCGPEKRLVHHELGGSGHRAPDTYLPGSNALLGNAGIETKTAW